MSRGRVGDFADDPNSIFVDLRPNPAWVAWADFAMAALAASAGYAMARRLGAGTIVAAVVAAFAAVIFGFKLSIAFQLRSVPRFDLVEFDAIRSAGSRALESFRAAEPSRRAPGWSLVGTNEQARTIAVIATGDDPRSLAITRVYEVPNDASQSPREVDAALHPRARTCQRIERPLAETVTSRG